jgi:hypothetical protein
MVSGTLVDPFRACGISETDWGVAGKAFASG